MKVCVKGVGTWGAGFENWPQLQDLLQGGQPPSTAAKSPKPEVIPANERRRAPLPARLAVETCSQAAASAGISPEDLACVFSSGLGDTDLTHYMCRELAGEHKQLSPTKFHNSVHNAAAGYWTIATQCRQPANSIAGLEQSVPMALLESVLQCQAENTAVMMACYDTPTNPVLTRLFANDQPFAAALVLTPADDDTSTATIECSVLQQRTPEWPSTHLPQDLSACYEHNPAARILPLLQALMSSQPSELIFPLSKDTSLRIAVFPDSGPDSQLS